MLEEILKDKGVNLKLTMLEVGAIPLGSDAKEPFHHFLTTFPGSRVIAFEVDKEECDRLNKIAPPGIEFHAQALGRAEETRDFYVAAAPMCSSLYPPNQEYCDLFHSLGELVRTTKKIKIDTVSLDHFAHSAGISNVDFIKIDIQGAELEFFQGGQKTLQNVVAIVTEVEFEPIYVGQPLYEDVTVYLRAEGFSFHKFLGVAGRALKPIVYNNNVNAPQQHLWTDAVYVRNLMTLDRLSDEQLFKLALLMETYGSFDLTHFALSHIDKRRKSDFAATYLKRATTPK